MPRSIQTICLALLLFGSACERSDTLAGPSLDAALRQDLSRWGVVPIGPIPAQNPALVDLGQALMFDPILSGNRDIACATCHHPATHLADGRSLSIGTGGSGLGPARTLGPGRQFVPRNAPSLLNDGLGLFYLFWDGRLSNGLVGSFNGPGPGPVPVSDSSGVSNLLAAQAMLPVVNRREMRGEPGDRDVFGAPNELAQFADSDSTAIRRAIMQRLLAIPAYVAKFTTAFPGTAPGQLRFEQAGAALAAFEIQALTKTDSPFDRYLSHDDAALTTQQKRGARLFFGKALCSSCHSGALLGGNGFANAGVPQLGPGSPATPPLDRGRADLPDQPFYQFAFRVAPLRNVELTAPYMHDGAFPTLEAVVRHYNDVPLALQTYDVAQLEPALRATYHGDAATTDSVTRSLDFRLRTPLHLSDQELADLVAFLKSLTDPSARDLSALVPAAVPSGLPVPR